jgi:hypothetical protein
MHLTCTRAQALFPPEGFKAFNDQPLSLLWDCHHGDTFVLMVKGLKVEPLSGQAAPEPLTLEVSLAPGHEVLATFQDFAAQHNLALTPLASKPLELEESLTLAACHVPGSKLFVYSEKAMLTARATPEGNVQLVVKGDFKSRKIPCQETDLLLHLERPGSTRLLNYCLSVIRGRS